MSEDDYNKYMEEAMVREPKGSIAIWNHTPKHREGDMVISLHRSRSKGGGPPGHGMEIDEGAPATHWLKVDNDWYKLPHKSVFIAKGELQICLDVLGAKKWEQGNE